MKLEKKYIIAGAIGIVSIAAGLAYLQYRKMLNYCIGIAGIKINKVTTTIADFDLSLKFQNKSNIAINILSQEYKVYVNNKFITKASNINPQVISADSTSIIAVNIKFNPTTAGQNLLAAILKMGNTEIKIDIKMKVKLWMFTISIPYVYATNLKELMIPSAKPKDTNTKCK